MTPNTQVPLRLSLGAGALLDDFIVGRNHAALAAVRELCAGGQGPVYLWGDAGSGKSHLLQAACRAADAVGRRAGYLACGTDAGIPPAVLEAWGELDLVCLDDVQRCAGDLEWERALFRLFEDGRERGHALLLAASHPPQALGFSLPDLRSRFGWGPVFQLRPLDDDGRLAALQARATACGFELPDETGWYLLARHARDMHALMRMLETLDVASLSAQRRLTIPFVRDVLAAPVN